MRTIPPTPQPARSYRGPVWLSRSLIVSAAVWLVLLGASLGAVSALAGARHEIRLQRFTDLEFTRSSFRLLERAADHGALQGAMTALWFLIAVLLVSAYAPVRVLFDPRELAELLVNRDRLLRAQVLIAVSFVIAMIALAYTEPGLYRAQAYLLGLLALTGITALLFIARMLRRMLRANHPHAEATAFAACAATLVVVALGFVTNSERIWRILATESIVANLLLALGALGTFVLTRRAVLYSNRTHAPAPRSALGGTLVRVALLASILPALAPLFVRAAAGYFGHSGVTPTSRLNVIVIAIDSLRADSVDLTPPAEGQRDRTPNLRKLAARGVQFTQAISQAPWSMPALGSVLTGKYPLEHGAVSSTGNLRSREVTLAELLREAGYWTGSVISDQHTDRYRGFRQGNEEFDEDCVLAADAISSQRITNQAIAFVERHAGQPFFLFAHYMDPHDAYRDHQSWTWADGYAGWWKEQNHIDNLMRNRNLVDEADLRWLRDLYDEEIAYTDSEIGRFLTALEKRRVLDHTLIAVVADHGEEFLDHGNFSHTATLYDELVHVPLILVVPGRDDAGALRSDVVETRSVFSTVLDRLGIDFDIEHRPPGLFTPQVAAAIAPVRPEDSAADVGKAFSIVWLPDSPPESGKRFQIISLRTARWKLIYNLTRDKYELYDIAADPDETVELSATHTQEFADLRQELERWFTGQKALAADLPHPIVIRDHSTRMRALGYK